MEPRNTVNYGVSGLFFSYKRISKNQHVAGMLISRRISRSTKLRLRLAGILKKMTLSRQRHCLRSCVWGPVRRLTLRKQHKYVILQVYLIYSGNKGKKPELLSFTNEFFSGNESTVEIKAKVLYGNNKKHDMISQYIAYCRVLDMQVKKHGRTKKAIEETIRICSDKDILKEYLEAHRKEVVDIMTQLYDREREMGLYVAEKERDAARKTTLENIKNLMQNLKMSAKEAMNALGIAPKDQKIYLPMLKKG